MQEKDLNGSVLHLPPPPSSPSSHPLTVRSWLSSQNFPAQSPGRNSINSWLLVIKLECAGELCSSYTCKDKLVLENVQRRATKFSLNYPKDMSYKDRSLKLNLLPREYWEPRPYLWSQSRPRRCRPSRLLPENRNTSTHAQYAACKFNYLMLYAKQNYVKHSFYYRSIATWKKLPASIKSTNLSLSSFKKRVLDIYTRNTLCCVLSDGAV